MRQISLELPSSSAPTDAGHVDGYWTTAEAANFLGKSERTIRRLLQTGAIIGHKVAGPNGLMWKVQPVETTTNSTNSGAVDELIAEYRAKEDQIAKLNEKVQQLEEALAKTSALHAKALQKLGEYEEKQAAASAASAAPPEVKASWWQSLKLPALCRPANATEPT